jgi:Ser/Thr protein kinase RdoA (MazF antagonist)
LTVTFHADHPGVLYIARAALDAFGLPTAALVSLNSFNNAVYQVEAGGSLYALRVQRPGGRRRDWTEAELAWLSYLDGRLCVRAPAAPLFEADFDGQQIYVVLFHWLHGAPIPSVETTADQAHRIGGYIAQLHTLSTAFQPPTDFTLPRLDWDGMFGAGSTYDPGEGAALFSESDHAVMNAVTARVRQTMSSLDQDSGSFGLIHGDLNGKNLLFDGDQVGAIDFDDCAWGYPLYDLTPILIGWKDTPQYDTLRAALWEGYTALRPLPAAYSAHLDTLLAGRFVLSCRWFARNITNPTIRERASQVIAHRISQLRRYLDTGDFSVGKLY